MDEICAAFEEHLIACKTVFKLWYDEKRNARCFKVCLRVKAFFQKKNVVYAETTASAVLFKCC